MINISLLDKIKQFFEIVWNSSNSWLVIGILIVLSMFVLLSCKMNDKFMKVFYVTLYIGILGLIMYVYYEQVLNLIDYLIENIVANILFPNLAIYIGVLLFINIVVLISLFSKNVKLYVKNINIIFFAIMQLFLYLIIENVISNSINVYEKLSIYTNQNLLILVELSMQLFTIWIIILGIIRLVDYFMIKSNNKVIEVKEDNKNKEINNDLVKEQNIIKEINITNYNNEVYDMYEDYYKDYYDDYDKNKSKDNDYNNSKTYQEPVKKKKYLKPTINKIDTTYNDNNKNYYYDKNNLFKKKYVVIVIILLILLSVLVVILMHSINVKTLPTGTTNNYINLFYSELELRVGDKKKLEVKLSETTKKYKIEWFSNNDNVVTVDKNGNIVAVNEGEAIILVAYYVDDKIYDDECRIHVLK